MRFLIIFLTMSATADVVFKTRPDKSIYDQCVDCHRTKNESEIAKKHQPVRRHEDIRLRHGNKEMSCNFCHDRNNHNLLMQYEGIPTSFREPSGVCAQCHSEEYKDWRVGLHGKRIGGWKGQRIQFHCTECHNPHSVPFAQMKALPAPPRPQLGIPKEN